MSNIQVTTNFRDNDGVDLGRKLITKDYLISAYPSISPQIGIDPELWIWGTGSNGLIGNNSTTNVSTPVTTSAGGSNWKQVSYGNDYMAAIKTDGTLWTWGYGGSGRLGTNDTISRSTPTTTLAGGNNWKQVSCGSGGNVSAIKTDGTLWTWGTASNSVLGRETNTRFFTPTTTFSGGTNWADTTSSLPEELYTLNSGSYHTLAIKTDGTLWCWGRGSYGRLGNNSLTTSSTPVTTFSGGTNWKQVSSGSAHTAAIKTDGTLWVWGFNSNGQLGNNATTNIFTPITTFAGGTDWKQVACSFAGVHTAAIKTDGTLWTWGYGGLGRLGVNDTTRRLTPVTTFAGGTNWKQITAGGSRTSAVKTDGTLWCWGIGSNGQNGDNTTTNKLTPVTTFAGGTNWSQVHSAGAHNIAVKTDGTLWAWGRAGNGQLGDNTIANKLTPVTTFAGGTNWKQVSGGYNHTVAIKTDGTLWTWGNGNFGKLGTNDTIIRSTPVTTFAGGTNWKQVNAGYHHTIALNDDSINKRLYVFGSNNEHQCGIPFTNMIIEKVFGDIGNWKQVSSGDNYAAAIKTDGTLWTWGVNFYANLGTNNVLNVVTPVTTFSGGSNWKQVVCGVYHTSAIKTDGTLWCWGLGQGGILGNNSTVYSSTPITTFAGGNNWKQVSCNYVNTAAVKTDGTLWIWGYPNRGQLGNNSTVYSSTPITTFAGGNNWKQVSIGYQTTAIKTDGTLWIWGNGNSGKLGNNSTTDRSTPITTFAGGTNWKQISSNINGVAAIKSVDF